MHVSGLVEGCGISSVVAMEIPLSCTKPWTHVDATNIMYVCLPVSGLILGLRPTNERQHNLVTTSLIDWVQAWNVLSYICWLLAYMKVNILVSYLALFSIYLVSSVYVNHHSLFVHTSLSKWTFFLSKLL